MSKKRKNLLPDIVTSDQLTIELVFGKAAWEKCQELQPDDEIVVVGNGPVCAYHGEYIENAEMVMRCNHYQKQTKSGDGSQKIGSKCDAQFICLHGKEFRKSGLRSLYDWCRDAKVVLALENANGRHRSPKRSRRSSSPAIPACPKSVCQQKPSAENLEGR